MLATLAIVGVALGAASLYRSALQADCDVLQAQLDRLTYISSLQPRPLHELLAGAGHVG